MLIKNNFKNLNKKALNDMDPAHVIAQIESKNKYNMNDKRYKSDVVRKRNKHNFVCERDLKYEFDSLCWAVDDNK